MAYFIAALTKGDEGWFGIDLDLEECVDVVDVRDEIRAQRSRAGADGCDSVVFVEGEEWFAIIRLVEGEPRVFVSEYSFLANSPFPELFADGVHEALYDWSGDPALLADLGVEPDAVQELAEIGVDPEIAIATIAEAAGLAELVESRR